MKFLPWSVTATLVVAITLAMSLNVACSQGKEVATDLVCGTSKRTGNYICVDREFVYSIYPEDGRIPDREKYASTYFEFVASMRRYDWLLVTVLVMGPIVAQLSLDWPVATYCYIAIVTFMGSIIGLVGPVLVVCFVFLVQTWDRNSYQWNVDMLKRAGVGDAASFFVLLSIWFSVMGYSWLFTLSMWSGMYFVFRYIAGLSSVVNWYEFRRAILHVVYLATFHYLLTTIALECPGVVDLPSLFSNSVCKMMIRFEFGFKRDPLHGVLRRDFSSWFVGGRVMDMKVVEAGYDISEKLADIFVLTINTITTLYIFCGFVMYCFTVGINVNIQGRFSALTKLCCSFLVAVRDLARFPFVDHVMYRQGNVSRVILSLPYLIAKAFFFFHDPFAVITLSLILGVVTSVGLLLFPATIEYSDDYQTPFSPDKGVAIGKKIAVAIIGAGATVYGVFVSVDTFISGAVVAAGTQILVNGYDAVVTKCKQLGNLYKITVSVPVGPVVNGQTTIEVPDSNARQERFMVYDIRTKTLRPVGPRGSQPSYDGMPLYDSTGTVIVAHIDTVHGTAAPQIVVAASHNIINWKGRKRLKYDRVVHSVVDFGIT